MRASNSLYMYVQYIRNTVLQVTRGSEVLFPPWRVRFHPIALLRRPSARRTIILDALRPCRPRRTQRLHHALLLPEAGVLAAIASLVDATISSSGRM
jgi:hypothetical protein